MGSSSRGVSCSCSSSSVVARRVEVEGLVALRDLGGEGGGGGVEDLELISSSSLTILIFPLVATFLVPPCSFLGHWDERCPISLHAKQCPSSIIFFHSSGVSFWRHTPSDFFLSTSMALESRLEECQKVEVRPCFWACL